jgi:hypothetical protein
MASQAVPRYVLAVGIAASLALMALVSGASATAVHVNAIDPGTRVKGMLVYQELARRAQASLFGFYCDPVVLSPGRRTRTCANTVPRVSRLFIGHGIFAPNRQELEKTWKRLTWAMWIDGQRVALNKFGWSDRWLSNFPPADGRTVLLREWAIVVARAQGRHTIRYRTGWPSGVHDTTWKFTVARK